MEGSRAVVVVDEDEDCGSESTSSCPPFAYASSDVNHFSHDRSRVHRAGDFRRAQSALFNCQSSLLVCERTSHSSTIDVAASLGAIPSIVRAECKGHCKETPISSSDAWIARSDWRA